MKITLLGTGTPTPSLRRMSSGYLVETGGDVIVLDHGPGAYHRLLQTGTAPTRVSHLFLSHLHYDHCMDYQRLVMTRWDQGAGRVPDLKVFGPAPLARMSEQLFSRDGVWSPDLTARTENELSLDVYRQRDGVLPRAWPMPEVREIRPGDTVSGGAWTLTVAEVVHVQPHLTCYAYRLETDEGVLVYSGDTGPTPVMEELARDCDVLIHMCHQMSGTAPSAAFAAGCMGHLELAELGQRANARNLVLTHITTQMDQDGVRERILGEMARIYEGHLFFGEDLMVVPLEGPRIPRLD